MHKESDENIFTRCESTNFSPIEIIASLHMQPYFQVIDKMGRYKHRGCFFTLQQQLDEEKGERIIPAFNPHPFQNFLLHHDLECTFEGLIVSNAIGLFEFFVQ